MAPTIKLIINWAMSISHSEAIEFHSINMTGTSVTENNKFQFQIANHF